MRSLPTRRTHAVRSLHIGLTIKLGLVITCTAGLASCQKTGPMPFDAPTAAQSSSGSAWSPPSEASDLPMGTPLSGHPFGKTDTGYAAYNPMHNLRFAFDAQGLQVTRPDASWQVGFSLTGYGRGQVAPVADAEPHVGACPNGSACDWRLQYHRGSIVEWYLNTVQGLEQGFDLTQRPVGAGDLIIQGRMQASKVSSSVEDHGETIAWRSGDKTAFSYARLAVVDANGLTVPARMTLTGDTLKLIIDDSQATWPLFVDPELGTCPSNWCSDGDPSTLDVCNNSGASCTNAFDDSYEGQPCAWGAFCCLDGKYHQDCSAPSVAAGQDCPADWCNDGDPGTIDVCSDYVVSNGTYTCTNGFDATQEGNPCVYGAFCCGDGQYHVDCSDPTIPTGQACPADWCNDGDPSTLDTCSGHSPANGSFTCGHVFDPSLEGQPCSYGAHCCADGLYHADCSDPSIPTGQDCPAGWCNDGDPGTLDACSNYTPNMGQFTCSNPFDPSLEGQPCVYGTFCCADGKYHPDCSVIAAGQPCPADWCNDGDPSTIDTCFNHNPANGSRECSNDLDPGFAGQPCFYGAFCCPDGIYKLDCDDECPTDPDKTQPGQCGCGVADNDSDNDTTLDCLEDCDEDPAKTVPGICGCGTPDDDTDSDGVTDCLDGCPTDGDKVEAGDCGCGVSEDDTDNDSLKDCVDPCPTDPVKPLPGVCGCGVPDTDTDGDGTLDCLDGCPADPSKTSAGVCGCGITDSDSDSDGTPNCLDGCPFDATKTAVGVCGCGIPDTTPNCGNEAITQDTLTDGQSLLAFGSACDSPTGDCVLEIVCSTINIADNTTATLDIDCGTPTSHATPVVSGTATFADVTLTNNSDCTVGCSAGSVSAADVTISVDRTVPTVVITAPLEDTIGPLEDLDDIADDLQFRVRVNASGLEAGQVITLTVTGASSFIQTLTVTEAIADGDTANLSFPVATLLGGDHVFVVSVSDAAGNSASDSSDVSVFVDQPFLRIDIPDFVEPVACSDVNPCVAGVCSPDGVCAQAAGLNTLPQLFLIHQNLLIEADNGRVCSNHPSLTANTACATAGFFELSTITLDQTPQAVDLDNLPEGLQTILIEGKITASTYISSTETGDISGATRTFFVDTTAPGAATIVAADDTAPLGCIDLDEGGSAPTMDVTCDADGQLEWRVNSVLQAITAVGADVAQQVTTTMVEGSNSLDARCIDVVGNQSTASILVLEIDSIPPSLAFFAPQSSPILIGDNATVAVASDEIGGTVVLTDSAAPSSPQNATVGANGEATFGALADGSHTLTASLTDTCGNSAEAEAGPFVVDTSAPALSITSPADNATLTDAEDASGDNGFQVAIAVTADNDTESFVLLAELGCDATFANCDAPQQVGSAAVSAAGAQTPVNVTLALNTDPEFVRITARGVDSNGNTSDATVTFQVTPTDCLVSLTELPANGQINASSCASGDSCASASLAFSASLLGDCSAVEAVRLVVDSVEGADVSVSGSTVALSYTIAHQDAASLGVVAVNAADVVVATSSTLALRADLEPPSISFVAHDFSGFTSPASDSVNAYNAASDQSAAPGLQIAARVQWTDSGFGGGSLASLDCAGELAAGLPATFAGVISTTDFAGILLPEADAAATCLLTATDDFGNQATTSFTFTADSVLPDSITLTLTGSQRRLPSVTMQFTAPGDNGTTGTASAYQMRYSRQPITETNFGTACDPTTLATVPTPAAPGATETIALAGPDGRDVADECAFVMLQPTDGPWYIAARAVDAAGNSGPVLSALVVEDELKLRAIKVTTTLSGVANATFGSRPGALGDVNNDGLADFALAGAQSKPGFCVFFGQDNETLSDLEAAGDNSTFSTEHECIVDDAVALGPILIKGAGDLNGDDIDDFGARWGAIGADADTADELQLRVYLGSDSGALTTHALKITGMSTLSWAGDGDFDGDGLQDLVIGDLQSVVGTDTLIRGRAWVIPGSAAWPAATLDLTDAADISSFNVASFVMVGNGGTSPTLGGGVAFVGPILGGDARDELAVSAWFTDGTFTDRAVVVFEGRDMVASAEYAVSRDFGGTSETGETMPTEDSTAVMLKNGGINGPTFGLEIISGDVDGDGTTDVIVSHPHEGRTEAQPVFHIFSGASLTDAGGEAITVHGGTTPVEIGHLAFSGPNGVTLRGDFASLNSLGGFNADAPGTADPIGLVYTNHDPNDGGVFVRFNTTDVAAGYGQYRYVDLELTDPFNPGNGAFGSFRTVGIEDFNGDGLDDILVGSLGAGYAVLLY